MGHLDFTGKPKADRDTPEAWLPVAAEIAEYARGFAGRADIVANVGPGIGGPYGTACWNPALADMDVNTDTCLPGYSPGRVHFHDEIFQLGALPFVGAVTHEAAHARWSCWVPIDLMNRAKAGDEAWDQATLEVVIALEESRIEHLAVSKDHTRKAALAQCALSIVLRDFTVADTLFGASISAALTLARYSLLSRAELTRFRTLVEEHLSSETIDKLAALWVEYHALPPHLAASGTVDDAHFAAMFDIATRWLDVLREEATDENGEKGETGIPGEPGEEGEGARGVFMPGMGGEGEGSGDTEGAGEDGDLAEKMREAAGEAAMDREGDALDKRAEKVMERRMADIAEDRKRHDDGKKVEDKRHGGGAHGYSSFAGSHKAKARPASPDERVAANRLSALLAKITFHDRVVTKVDRVVPGGKLRPRAAVQRAAEIARGGHGNVAIWRGKERHHTDETPITVAIATDVSGSMGRLSEPSAVLTWVLSNAVAGIDGKVATATFGDAGYLVNRAYEKAEAVQPWIARDGTEAFREAALLLDHELDLLDSTGARILVVFTDAYFVNGDDARFAETFMRLCKAKGVSVIWACADGKPSQNFGYGTRVAVSGTAAKIANTLGDAIVAEVRKVERAKGA